MYLLQKSVCPLYAMSMELKWLEDFLAIAELGTFSAAAKARNVTQPAFSRRIRSLEHWLGVTLIDRKTNPLVLTQAGLEFKENAAGLVRDFHRVRSDLRESASSGGKTITVIAPHVLALSVVPQWLKTVNTLDAYRTRLITDNVHECLSRMMLGDADFLITFFHPQIPLVLDRAQFPFLELGHETLAPFSAMDQNNAALFQLPGTPKSRLPYLGYGDGTFLQDAIELHLKSVPTKPFLNTIVENSISDSLKFMAADGLGIAWLPEAAVDESTLKDELVRAGDDTWTLSLGLRLYRAAERTSPHVEKIWAHMKACYSN